MQTFREWLEVNHEEFYSEVNWGKLGRTALAAGALCTGIGCTQNANPNAIPSSSVTSPDAAQFLDDTPSDSWTSPEAGKFLSSQSQKPTSNYQKAFSQHHQRMEKSRQNIRELQSYASQLKNSGRNSGVFVNGQLVNNLEDGQEGLKITINGNQISKLRVVGPNAEPVINMD